MPSWLWWTQGLILKGDADTYNPLSKLYTAYTVIVRLFCNWHDSIIQKVFTAARCSEVRTNGIAYEFIRYKLIKEVGDGTLVLFCLAINKHTCEVVAITKWKRTTTHGTNVLTWDKWSQWFLEKFLRWQDWYKTDPENDCSCWRNKNGRGKRCWRKRANKILKQNLIRNMEEKRIREDKRPAAILNLWFRSVAGLTMSRKWENGDCVLNLWLCLVWGFKKKNGEGVEEKLTWP